MVKEELIESVKNFPESSGVYLMSNAKGVIIYVGKATSLKHRVMSYFQKNLPIKTAKQMNEVVEIEYIETDSTVEAILLESRLIKKHSPVYNIKDKDDKSRLYIHITQEDFPRVYSLRETDLVLIREKNPILYGPFFSGASLSLALEMIRKIAPFRSCRKLPKKRCLYGYLGLCSAPCLGDVNKVEYRKNIHLVRDFFEGRKERVLSSLKKDLKNYSKHKEYEQAAKVRDRLYALEHLKQSFAIKKETNTIFDRVEGYDISNISGEFATGSMVVFIDGLPEKSEYRKFKIKNIRGANDTGMMTQVLRRRFRNDWPHPDLIVIDGGKGQVNSAVAVLKSEKLDIPIVGLAKGIDRKKDEIITSRILPRGEIVLFKQVRDEAHRFAKGYYQKLHRRDVVGG
jgi:excinuclease ABC subunit C